MAAQSSGVSPTPLEENQALGYTTSDSPPVGFVLLIAPLWTWMFYQFSVHLTIHLPKPLSACLVMMLWNTASKALLKSVNNMNCSPTIQQLATTL